MRHASSVVQESAFDSLSLSLCLDLPEPQSVPHTRHGYQHLSGDSYEDEIRDCMILNMRP